MASDRRSILLGSLPFSASTTPAQAMTYLLGISLFSVSFLVFLNSSVSFVITDRIGQRKSVGDIVGTLGFADELVALVACPVWGLASDRLGVRNVAVIGYAVIGLALFVFVQARNVYPQLLLARLLFAVGATAAATMVTAILPSLTADGKDDALAADQALKRTPNVRDSVALSLDSQTTITPANFRNNNTGGDGDVSRDGASRTDVEAGEVAERRGEPARLAGYVGLFTGCGALVALGLFLPLPTRFGQVEGVTVGEAVEYSFYVVGAVALLVAAFVFFGLRGLRGEEGKGWRVFLRLQDAKVNNSVAAGGVPAPGHALKQNHLPYWQLLKDSVQLGFTDSEIALGYLGGFVARASTVAISLFVPLFVNAYFIGNGFCQGSPNDPSPDLKKECRQAYILASMLTGVAQLMGLLCAPLFGYFSSRSGRLNSPVIAATSFGIIGYAILPKLPSPEYNDVNGRGGSPAVFVLAALIGISQIGAIVCSLGSLGRGVLRADVANLIVNPHNNVQVTVLERPDALDETAPLIENVEVVPEDTVSRVRLKGSIAGVYSWYGGAAILLLTKLGGYLFDSWTRGAPFYMMAVFNGVLLVASLGVDLRRFVRKRRAQKMFLR